MSRIDRKKRDLRREWLRLTAMLDAREPLGCGMTILAHYSPECQQQAEVVRDLLSWLQRNDGAAPATPSWVVTLAGGARITEEAPA